MTQCRHCFAFRMDDTYASVLVADGPTRLPVLLGRLEQRIIPCTTAVCSHCNQISALSNGSIDSLLRTVVMWRRLKDWIDEVGETKDMNGEDIF
jgi:hypothetical protein